MKLGRFSISLQYWADSKKLCWISGFDKPMCGCYILTVGPICLEWLSEECK